MESQAVGPFPELVVIPKQSIAAAFVVRSPVVIEKGVKIVWLVRKKPFFISVWRILDIRSGLHRRIKE